MSIHDGCISIYSAVCVGNVIISSHYYGAQHGSKIAFRNYFKHRLLIKLRKRNASKTEAVQFFTKFEQVSSFRIDVKPKKFTMIPEISSNNILTSSPSLSAASDCWFFFWVCGDESCLRELLHRNAIISSVGLSRVCSWSEINFR